jgi:hypothetical protein
MSPMYSPITPSTISWIPSAARSGPDEKLITPVAAKRSIFVSGYFVSPAKRSSRA